MQGAVDTSDGLRDPAYLAYGLMTLGAGARSHHSSCLKDVLAGKVLRFNERIKDESDLEAFG